VAALAIPPFESFYEQHRDAIFGHLARLLGRAAAEDAFQETFLRALRAYPNLRHCEHLRAWIFTIATRVAFDQRAGDGARARSSTTGLLEHEGAPDSLPPFQELEELTSDLPPTERAAVVLRYGYDLDYDAIGTALGSSEEAARQAASSGVRRLRRRLGGAVDQDARALPVRPSELTGRAAPQNPRSPRRRRMT
jgi:RNA polymerase sigma factor (sigma-70 family)